MIQIGRSSSPPRIALSVIVPSLNEIAALPGTLESLGLQGREPPLEVILADGGSGDGTVEIFREMTRSWAGRGWGVGLVTTSRPCRAHQMNAGARAASGEALLFLHADTHLPPGAAREIVSALADPRVVGGGFRHRFREPGLYLRLISHWATARSRLRRIHYGDQAIFVRRSVFETIGGYPEIALFEDLYLALMIRARGRVITLPLAAETSARRLLQGGIGRTSVRFAWMKLRHAIGADPSCLKSGYPDVR